MLCPAATLREKAMTPDLTSCHILYRQNVECKNCVALLCYGVSANVAGLQAQKLHDSDPQLSSKPLAVTDSWKFQQCCIPLSFIGTKEPSARLTPFLKPTPDSEELLGWYEHGAHVLLAIQP